MTKKYKFNNKIKYQTNLNKINHRIKIRFMTLDLKYGFLNYPKTNRSLIDTILVSSTIRNDFHLYY